jgi:predicted RNase H-like HicB family nuclease
MATHYPIVLEQEESGVYSAYVAGLSVYAQGATRSQAEAPAQSTSTPSIQSWGPEVEPRR